MAEETQVQANAPAESGDGHFSGTEEGSFGAQEQSAPATPDVSEQIQGLKQMFEERLPAQQQAEPEQPWSPQELQQAFINAAQEPELTEQDLIDAGIDPNEYFQREQAVEETDQDDPRLAAMQQQLAEMQEANVRREIGDLVAKYPDMGDPKVIQGIENKIGFLGGDAFLNPQLIELGYLATKAEMNARQEKPAEEARRTSLETEAGPGNRGEESYEKSAVSEILNAGGGSSVFG